MEFPFHKKYISTLLHKPDLISNSTRWCVDIEDDVESEKALNCLQASAIHSINEEWDWKHRCSKKPPQIKHLFAYVFGNFIENEDEVYILKNFPEAIVLKEIYDTVPADEKILSEEPDVNDFFGFEREKKENERIAGATYFDDIGTLGKNMNCSKCGGKDFINGSNRFRFKAEPIDRIVYQYEHQCQGCGKLKMAEYKDPTDNSLSLQLPCECGGEFRRDKPLFCPHCNFKKFTDV